MIRGVSKSVAQAAGGGLCLLLAALSGIAGAGDADFDYDVFLHNDTLMIWIDVTPAMTQPRMEDLVAGLNISLRIDIDVERPRKLFFSKTVTSAKSILLVSRHLTRDTYRLDMAGAAAGTRIFKNQLTLSDYLADSLEFPVAPADLLSGLEVRLAVTVISKSYSHDTGEEFESLRGDTADAEPGGDSEFFGTAFSAFLDLIGFGTSSYHITTPTFSTDDLPVF